MKRLNPFQKIAIEQIKEERDKGANRILINMPPGIGKTLVAIKDSMNYKRVLYVAHHNELIKQTYDAFSEFVTKDKLHLIKDKKDFNNFKRFNFVTIQLLKNYYKNLNKSIFSYIIIDEAHHSPAKTYKNIIEYFQSFFLGLTATPFRSDKNDVIQLFNNNLITVGNLHDAIKKGYLTKFLYYGFKDNVDYTNIKRGEIDYNRRDLDKRLFIDERDYAVINKYKEYAIYKKTIGFCNSINHVKRCVKFFKKEGIDCEGFTCDIKKKERNKIFNKFKNGNLKLIFTVNIFNEGLDFPDADVALLLRPSMSYGLILQQVGRALRKHPNKKTALILDFVGNHIGAFKIRQVLSGDIHFFNSLTKKPVYVYPLDCEVHFEEKVEDGINQQLTLIFMRNIQEIVREYIRIKKEAIKWRKIPFEEEILIYGNKTIQDFIYHVGIFEMWYIMGENVKSKQIRQQRLISKFLEHQNQFNEIDKKLVINCFDSWNNFKKIVSNFKKSHLLELQGIYINSTCPRCLKKEAISPHHIIPRESGGGDNKENIIYLCIECHNEVEMLTDDWIEKRGLINPQVLRKLIINLGLYQQPIATLV